MPTVRVHTTLGPDTLKLPELAPLLGQEVEVRVRPVRKRKRLTADERYLEEVRRELEAGGPVPTLEEIRAMNAGLTGISDQIIADREDRF